MGLKKFTEKMKHMKMKKDQILILFLSGILLLIITIPTNDRKDKKKEEDRGVVWENSSNDNIEYAQYLEKKLENILAKIDGAGEVAVMVTMATSAEQVVEKDMEISDELIMEADSQGGERTTNQSSRSETAIYNGEENGLPYVSKEISPKVEGVVVIADGGDNAVVVKNITESVQALFGIESHKIRIVKKGG